MSQATDEGCNRRVSCVLVVVGAVLLVSAGAVAWQQPAPVSVPDFDKWKDVIKTSDALLSLVETPYRVQTNLALSFLGLGAVLILLGAYTINERLESLGKAIARKFTTDVPSTGLILVTFVVLFALVAIPIQYHPTSQFFLDLAKIGFGAFLATYINKK